MFVNKIGFTQSFSITIDDPSIKQTSALSSEKIDLAILEALEKHQTKAVLFVCTKRVNSPRGRELLKRWSKARHLIANHTENHWYYHSKKYSSQDFILDIEKAHKKLKDYSTFSRLFRFPFLKAGNSEEKRDSIRDWLEENQYSHGYVTIDASDWYISLRLEQRLKANPNADLEGYKDFYLQHMLDRAHYYNDLAKKTLGRDVSHTLLIHHNILNALFLSDLIEHFKKNGWKLIDADEAFKDSVFTSRPKILPAGESIIWSLAKEAGNKTLRYPAEDGRYEKEKMDKLGL